MSHQIRAFFGSQAINALEETMKAKSDDDLRPRAETVPGDVGGGRWGSNEEWDVSPEKMGDFIYPVVNGYYWVLLGISLEKMERFGAMGIIGYSYSLWNKDQLELPRAAQPHTVLVVFNSIDMGLVCWSTIS